FGKIATGLTQGLGEAAQFAVTTVVGGTVSVIGGGKFANGAAQAGFGYLFNALQRSQETNQSGGAGPNEVGARGVAEVMYRYRTQGYTIIDIEVAATLPGFDYSRRYDFVTRSLETGAFIGVEVKASEVGLFRLDTRQVNFDTALLATGGATVPGEAYKITGIRYEGISFSSSVNARWQQGYLYWRLRLMGVEPARTKAPN
ncbi:MAG: hypothetical protein ACK5T1_08170, partial [Betaproteobacteria bacterium]